MVEGVDWAAVVVTAYALHARPPLTTELSRQLRQNLALVVKADGGEVASSRSRELVESLNEALDAFEKELRAVAGPRIKLIDTVNGTAVMIHRSEAARPLRAFGGQ